MTESNRQHRSAQPHRPGTGSVPVLFSLRNVQPNIVGGIANSAKSAVATTSAPAEKSTGRAESTRVATPVATPVTTQISTPVAAQAVAAAQPVPKPVTANSNRSFNVVVGLLVIALCLLVIRNTQNTNNGANITIASNSGASQSGLKTETNFVATPPPLANMGTTNSPNATAKQDPFPPLPNLQPPTLQLAEQRTSNDKPLELGSFGTPVQVPSTNSVANIDLIETSSPNDTSKDPVSLQGTVVENGTASRGLFEQNIVQAKPSLLSPSTKPETTPSSNPTFGFPDTRVAMNSLPANSTLPGGNSLNASVEAGAANTAKPGEGASGIVDSINPNMTTRELIDLRNRSNSNPTTNSFDGQSFPKPSVEPSVSANPVSYVPVGAGSTQPNNLAPYQPIPSPNTPSAYQPIPSTNTPSVYQPLTSNNTLSGRSYPPLPQENPAVRVPPYEQSASGAAQQSQMIRQPGANNSNRYPTAVSPQIPYTPVAPSQGANSFGYPPGK